DRGGELVLRELLQIADIDYIARAPPGKEVEELTAKEIAKALHNKVPVEQFQFVSLSEKRQEITRVETPKEIKPIETKPLPIGIDYNKVKSIIESLQGSLEAELLDENWEVKHRVAVRDLADFLQNTNEKIYGVIFDGVITQRLLDVSCNKGISILIGARIGNIAKKPQSISILTFEDILPCQET
ncbi:MAG: hypothetical protein N3D72_02980, partial [Candidatus Methanomethyliaceae archaeon]|nr:hypothetical protein [Candidatus Methanomethyliaceae archaeon]